MLGKAYVKIITAASLWGCIGVFLKLLTGAGFSSMEGVAIRALAACLLYGGFLAFTDPGALRISPKDWYYFFGTGVCSLLFFNWCYFNAISRSSMSVAAVLLYTAPVFVTLMSALFFHESITPPKLLALAVTFAGCTLVTGLFPLGQEPISPATILFGLGSGFGYALYSIFSKFALKKYSPATISFYSFLFCAVFSLPLSGLHRDLDSFGCWQAWAGAPGHRPFLLRGALCALYRRSPLRRARPGRHPGHRGALRGRRPGHPPVPGGGHTLQAAGHGRHPGLRFAHQHS